jgi:limonene-1,2-epoxide hydrolase
MGAAGDVVLTERTDVLSYGPVRVQFWVYGRFEVRRGQIAVWRDSFDWLTVTGATIRGLLGAVLPPLRARPPKD